MMVVYRLVRKVDRSIVINTFESCNDYVLDLVPK
jgi:hypothetical protein